MAILPAARYDDIRLAVDLTVDGSELFPDEVLQSPLVLGRAERWALSLDPLGETRTGDDLEHFHTAIVYQAAAILSEQSPQARQVNQAGHTATFVFAETPVERTARLQNMAVNEIVAYLPALIEALEPEPFFVTTVSGRRG
jgi:hypothetical protein